MGMFVALESKLSWMRPLWPFRRWFPLTTLVIGLPLWASTVGWYPDFSAFLILLLAYPVCAVVLLVLAAVQWRQWSYGLPTLVVFFAVSWLVCRNAYPIRASCRWLLKSNDYKAQLYTQPLSPNGQLRHMEWDGWGMAGQDTTAYLVHDPGDLLSAAAQQDRSGKLPGIPCGVWKLQRLEAQWYSVVLYTNTAWEIC